MCARYACQRQSHCDQRNHTGICSVWMKNLAEASDSGSKLLGFGEFLLGAPLRRSPSFVFKTASGNRAPQEEEKGAPEKPADATNVCKAPKPYPTGPELPTKAVRSPCKKELGNENRRGGLHRHLSELRGRAVSRGVKDLGAVESWGGRESAALANQQGWGHHEIQGLQASFLLP